MEGGKLSGARPVEKEGPDANGGVEGVIRQRGAECRTLMCRNATGYVIIWDAMQGKQTGDERGKMHLRGSTIFSMLVN
jgi:hypothetical protein